MIACVGETARSSRPWGFMMNSLALSRRLLISVGSSRTNNRSLALTKTLKTFLVASLVGSGGSSVHGGSCTVIPLSESIVVVTRKKINRRKAISAIDPAFTSGAVFLSRAIIVFFGLLK